MCHICIKMFTLVFLCKTNNLKLHKMTEYSGKPVLVREPIIGLIKWLRPKGLKVCSYEENCAEFKNQTLKKIGWYTKVLCATDPLIVSKFHSETHDPKEQENKFYTIVYKAHEN